MDTEIAQAAGLAPASQHAEEEEEDEEEEGAERSEKQEEAADLGRLTKRLGGEPFSRRMYAYS